VQEGVYVIGAEVEHVAGGGDRIVGTPDELAGSEYLRQFHGLVVGSPRIDLALEARVQHVLVEAARQGLLRSAHDSSHGGLAVTLAEACWRSVCRKGRSRTARRCLFEAASRVVV
jgi:phosphoribosylformylglycinamidine (FGAM) synthase-like enzyme